MRRIVVAIDGPAASGKTSVSKRIAVHLGYAYIDTGAMYRAATWKAMKKGVDLTNEEAVARLIRKTDISVSKDGRVYVDGEDVSRYIREPDLTKRVFYIARNSKVRSHLVALQRNMLGNQGIVMEGRDIGTVVFPEALVKIYLDATLDERAKRRLKDLNKDFSDIDEIRSDIEARDRSDFEREDSPLRKAEDAIYVDTTNLTLDEVVESCLEIIKKRLDISYKI
ncbi:MAG: (d)CMP kinase [bacterium]|nr:(d)CMP kinase [bacterium]